MEVEFKKITTKEVIDLFNKVKVGNLKANHSAETDRIRSDISFAVFCDQDSELKNNNLLHFEVGVYFGEHYTTVYSVELPENQQFKIDNKIAGLLVEEVNQYSSSYEEHTEWLKQQNKSNL